MSDPHHRGPRAQRDISPSSAHTSERSGRNGDGGFTLVEVLFAVLLMSTSFAAILGGLRMAVLGTDMHHKQAAAEPVLTSAAEHLKAAPYEPCVTERPEALAAYRAAVQSAAMPPGWAPPEITAIDYGDGTTFSSTCWDANGLHLQRITIEVTAPDSRATESVEVVKGQP